MVRARFDSKVPASTLVDVFPSTGPHDQKRSLLKELIHSLLSVSMHQIISRTGISIKVVTEVFSSGIAKYNDHSVQIFTNVAESQWGYISQYIPIINSNSKWFLSKCLMGMASKGSIRDRISYWLCG
jgi:hypothetical protein